MHLSYQINKYYPVSYQYYPLALIDLNSVLTIISDLKRLSKNTILYILKGQTSTYSPKEPNITFVLFSISSIIPWRLLRLTSPVILTIFGIFLTIISLFKYLQIVPIYSIIMGKYYIPFEAEHEK